MADWDRKLVVRNVLTPMAEKGSPYSPKFLVILIGKIIHPIIFLRPKLNFLPLTVCRLDQYLPHSSEKSGFALIDSHAEAYYQLPFAVTAARSKYGIPACAVYRVCGLALTAGIAMKFGTAHGRSRLGVGGAKCIGSYDRKGVPPVPCNFGAY